MKSIIRAFLFFLFTRNAFCQIGTEDKISAERFYDKQDDPAKHQFSLRGKTIVYERKTDRITSETASMKKHVGTAEVPPFNKAREVISDSKKRNVDPGKKASARSLISNSSKERDGNTTFLKTLTPLDIVIRKDPMRNNKLKYSIHHDNNDDVGKNKNDVIPENNNSSSSRNKFYFQADMPKNVYNSTPSEPKIIGGVPASPGEFTFFASITSSATKVCGASLVAPDILLTAAHCRKAFQTGAIIGNYLLGINTPGSVQVSVVAKIIHPDHQDSETCDCFDNDIMVLKIYPPITTTQPVALNFDPAHPAVGEALTIIGFGSTYDEEKNKEGKSLQKAQVKVGASSVCNDEYYDEKTMICVWNEGSLRNNTCFGDSGGPLLQGTGKSILGVISFGINSCSAGPSYFTRLTAFADFIKGSICSLSAFTPTFDCEETEPPPTIETTTTMTTYPLPSCGTERTAFQMCFRNEMTEDQVNSCVACMNSAFPSSSYTCSGERKFFCTKPSTCGCSSCFDEVSNYLRCDLGCMDVIDCGGPAIPTSTAPLPSCVRRNKHCFKSSDCCGKLKCRGFVCKKKCKKLESRCQKARDCCSRNCVKKRCKVVLARL